MGKTRVRKKDGKKPFRSSKWDELLFWASLDLEADPYPGLWGNIDLERDPDEFQDYLRRNLRRKDRTIIRSRTKKSARWDDPQWNPEHDLVPIERSTFSPEDFRVNPSIVIADPRVIEFLSKDPQRLFALSPRQFEELIAELMHRLGYSVQLGPLGRDGGVDLFAESKSEVGDELVLIQCKRYRDDRKIGEPIVKQLHADVHDRSATRGLVATTSYFSSTALNYIERNRFRLSGVDQDELMAWMARVRKL